jgi:MarR family transcriptional regulator for hemolysin
MNEPLSIDKDFNLWVLLNQAKDAVLKIREKELIQYGITAREAAALFIIQSIREKTTPAEIARWIFREHHTVTALLSRMERKGLVTKVKDSKRKSVWIVKLTEKGQNACRQSLKRESIHTAMSPLSGNERQQLESSLRKVRDQALKHSVSEPTLPFP